MICKLLFFLGTYIVGSLVHGEGTCSVSSDIIMVYDAFSAQGQYGSASPLRPGFVQPWPLVTVGNRQLRVVKYCYTDAVARNHLHCGSVMPAFTHWADKLGYPAGEQTGHSLAWEEASDGNKDLSKRKIEYCYKDYKHLKQIGTWNSLVDPGTLVIALDPESTGGEATLGYNVLNNERDRHHLILGPRVDIGLVIHEIGHVFGMAHEVHRDDRDDYVLYQCKNVEGYDAALAKAISTGSTEAEARTKLCEDQSFARKHGFIGTQFTKNPRGKSFDEPGGFDLMSIMLYSSEIFSNQWCLMDQTACALLQLVKVNGRTVGLERIPVRSEPSNGDIAWLKMWYPWV